MKLSVGDYKIISICELCCPHSYPTTLVFALKGLSTTSLSKLQAVFYYGGKSYLQVSSHKDEPIECTGLT